MDTSRRFPGGVWPVMLTPFLEDGKVDYKGLERLTDWYIGKRCQGLFAVCQSSEMFFLSEEERLDIARAVVKAARGRVPVIACGNLSQGQAAQIEETMRMARTGVEAVVLVTNGFASQEEDDAVWLGRCERFLREIDGKIPLGFYECPYPYKRLISLENLKKCARTGRFYFLKDTCCDLALIEKRLEAVQGTNLEIYNANSATLLDSLRRGVHGFSGVMANFHPELYAELCSRAGEERGLLQDFLTVASWAEYRNYPMCAKYYLHAFEGIQIGTYCRKPECAGMDETLRREMEMLRELTEQVKAAAGTYVS